MSSSLAVEWLGELPYGEALAVQDRAVVARRAGHGSDRLLLLEHPPVVTLGRSTDPAHLKISPDRLRERGVEVFEVSRGGDVTYHGPGQLVGYPILDLDALGRRDVRDHLRRIEAGLIDALEASGVPAKRIPGRTGVFVDRDRSARPEGPERKIASIGVGVRKWVTLHGFALNISVDLAGFEAIVPCGLSDVVMTSVAQELEWEASETGQGSADLDGALRSRVERAMIDRLLEDASTPD